ncbi:MAG: ribonuclease H-like domain-containing protein [Planctomycetota bacterium]
MVAPRGPRARRDKLRRAFGVPEPAAPASDRASEVAGSVRESARESSPPVRPVPTMREFLQQRRRRRAQAGGESSVGAFAAGARPAVELPEAEVRATEHGDLWLRQLRYPPEHIHGRTPLADAQAFDAERVAVLAKDPGLADLRPEQCLFLDTETTGLSGGAGTVVFNYGMAFFEGEELCLEQLFLRDFSEEPAMLQHVAERLRQRPVLVTYVGKSYDRHRIAARLAVHKIAAPVLTDRHLDLYHVVRRQFGSKHSENRWPDSRLRTAEERLLGFHREHDLPGSEAPAAFLDWIRNRSGPVDQVLEHNRLDVLSLVALLGALFQP